MPPKNVSDDQLDEWLGSAPAKPPKPNVQISGSVRIPCPVCAELIQPSALKCRFCGTNLVAARTAETEEKIRSVSRPAHGSGGVATILSFFVPGAGQVYRGEILWGLFLLLAFVFCNSLWMGLRGNESSDTEKMLTFAGMVGAFVIWILSMVSANRK